MRNTVIDYAAAEANGVTVCGTASTPTPPVELTWALLLGLARGLVTENAALRDGGPWQSTVGADLNGRRLGLLGLGKLGSRVARIGPAFGMEVLAWSQNLTAERAEEVGADPRRLPGGAAGEQRLRLRPPRPRATAPVACRRGRAGAR